MWLAYQGEAKQKVTALLLLTLSTIYKSIVFIEFKKGTDEWLVQVDCINLKHEFTANIKIKYS